MKKLSLLELNRLTPDEYADAKKINVTVVLDNLRSGHNIGSFFRTSDALSMDKIILTGICVTPPNPEIHKTAIGADLTVKWEYYRKAELALQILKKEGYYIIGVEQTSKSISLQNFDFKEIGKIALVFGNEVNGLSTSLLPILDSFIDIPQFGTKHSFNVSVCGGIVLWETAKAKLL